MLMIPFITVEDSSFHDILHLVLLTISIFALLGAIAIVFYLIKNDIKLFFKKKPTEYQGFKIGDRVVRFTNYYIPSSTLEIVKIVEFEYDKYKDIYRIQFSDGKDFRAAACSLMKPKQTRSNLPGWW